MKQKFFMLIAVCAMMLVSIESQGAWRISAAPETKGEWRLGVTGGATYNWYSVAPQYQTDSRYNEAWGWNAGAFGQYNFKDWVGLRFELQASQRNHRFYQIGQFADTMTCNNTYLQIPLMANFSFGGKKVRGFVNAGIYGGYWLTGKLKGTQFNPTTGAQKPLDETYTFQAQKDQRWDFGLAGGLGIEYRFHPHWVMHVEARCYYSFVSNVKQYAAAKDYRFNTTIGTNIGFAYIF